MAIAQQAIKDREFAKFRDCNGETVVAVEICQESGDAVKVQVVDDGDGGQVTNIFNEVTAVAQSTPTTVVTYTVPVGQTLFVKEVESFGTNIATYRVFVDAVKQREKDTYFTTYETSFNFYNMQVSEGETIRLEVEHDRTEVGDFKASIIGNLV